MSYYAQFESESHSNEVFRFDARIYLSENPARRTDGRCVAAIVGKNPGSASYSTVGTWEPLNLNGDKMLPTVRNRFVEAYKRAGKPIPRGAYVQVWNLFYLCDKTLSSAIKAAGKLNLLPPCRSEKITPPIVWFAWGGDDKRLNKYKGRFLNKRVFPEHVFFYDYNTEKITLKLPTITSPVKHPQGLPAEPIVKHLAEIL